MKKPETLQDALDLVMRDAFATSALQGMLARPKSSPFDLPTRYGTVVEYVKPAKGSPRHYAEAAYLVADAMMEARKQ